MEMVAERELFRACHVLFGSDLTVSRDFLAYLQPAGVKKAYRQRALETHPDLSPGEAAMDAAADFRAVKAAYEALNTFLEARAKGFRFSGPETLASPPPHARAWRSTRRGDRSQRESWRADSAARGNGARHEQANGSFSWNCDGRYRGPLPGRTLLIGHYLYYAGVISWRHMIQALVWQRMQRPRVGEIAQRLGWLTDEEVRQIFRDRQTCERFGASAQRLGLLSDFQMKVLLHRQQSQQKRFGVYFVERGLLSEEEMSEHVRQCKMHNTKMKTAHCHFGHPY